MATFNKSNWTPTASSEHARVYVPNAIAAATNISGNGAATVITMTVPWQFKGNGQITVSVPVGATALNTGLSFGEPQLLGPASGSYASGGHPRVQVALINDSNVGVNVQAGQGDLILVQY